MSQNLLTGQPEYMEDRGPDVVQRLEARIENLADRVAELEHGKELVKRDAVVALLNVLGRAMKDIAAGQFDLTEMPERTVAAPQFDPKWDAWKQKLGGTTAPARVIDALLTHGSLNRTQLRSAAELGWSTLDAATSRLKNLSLIEKVGDRWQLKQL